MSSGVVVGIDLSGDPNVSQEFVGEFDRVEEHVSTQAFGSQK